MQETEATCLQVCPRPGHGEYSPKWLLLHGLLSSSVGLLVCDYLGLLIPGWKSGIVRPLAVAKRRLGISLVVARRWVGILIDAVTRRVHVPGAVTRPLLPSLFVLFLVLLWMGIPSVFAEGGANRRIGYLHPHCVYADSYDQVYIVFGMDRNLRFRVWDGLLWDGNMTGVPHAGGRSLAAMDASAPYNRKGWYGDAVNYIRLGYLPNRPSIDGLMDRYLLVWDEKNELKFHASRMLVGYHTGGGKYFVDEFAWIPPVYNVSRYAWSHIIDSFTYFDSTPWPVRGGGRDYATLLTDVAGDKLFGYTGPDKVVNVGGRNFFSTVLWLEGNREEKAVCYYKPKGNDRGLYLRIKDVYETGNDPWRESSIRLKDDTGLWCDMAWASGSWRGSQAEAFDGMGDSNIQSSFFVTTGVRSVGGGADKVMLIHHLHNVPAGHAMSYNVEWQGKGPSITMPGFLGGKTFYLFGRKRVVVPIGVSDVQPGQEYTSHGYVVREELTQIDGYEDCWSSSVAVGVVSDMVAWAYCNEYRQPVVAIYRPYFAEQLAADVHGWKPNDFAEEWLWRSWNLAPYLGPHKEVRNIAVAVDDNYGAPHVVMTVRDQDDYIDIWYAYLDVGGWNVSKKVDDWCHYRDDRGVGIGIHTSDKIPNGGLAFIPRAMCNSSFGMLEYSYNGSAVVPFTYGAMSVSITWPAAIGQYELFTFNLSGSATLEYFEIRFFYNWATSPVYEKTAFINTLAMETTIMLWHSGVYGVEVWGKNSGGFMLLHTENITVVSQPKSCRVLFDWGYRWHDKLNFSIYQKGWGHEVDAWELIIATGPGGTVFNNPLDMLWYEYDISGVVYGAGGSYGINITLDMVPDSTWTTFQLGSAASFPLEFSKDYVAFIRPRNASNVSMYRNWPGEAAAYMRFGLYKSDPSGVLTLSPGGGTYSEAQRISFECCVYGVPPAGDYIHDRARLVISDRRGRKESLTLGIDLDEYGEGWVKTAVAPAGKYTASLYVYRTGFDYYSGQLSNPNLYKLSSSDFTITSTSLWGDVLVETYDRFGEQRVTWLISAVAIIGLGAFIGAGTRDGNLSAGFIILGIIIFAAEAWLPQWILIAFTVLASYFCIRFLRSMYSLAEY